MIPPAAPPADLREACVSEAIAIIAQTGLEGLSLREVARRLGVSHQAPYRHFPSRDHVVAEVVRRAFDEFATALGAHQPSDDAATDFLAMGLAYVEFALTRPLYYRLMFGGALPDPATHPAMMQGAGAAFALLRQAIARVFAERGERLDRDAIDREAVFAWSSLHGMVSLWRTDALETLDLAPDTRSQFAAHALRRIGAAFGLAPPAQSGD